MKRLELFGAKAKNDLNSMELKGYETYCRCEIVWHDDFGASPDVVTIKLNCGVEEDEDEDIFFYVNGINGLLGLTNWDNGEDFTINEIYEIY